MSLRRAALVLAAVLTAAPAAAQDATAQARVLFDAGAKAYEAGQFTAALQAFQEAYRLAPRTGILFSMAQASRKQYFVDRQPARLRQAIKLYREYVAKVPQGGRRGDAVQALAELEPMAERLGADVAAAAMPERKAATQIMVSAVKEATVLVDGKPIDASMFHEVKPGKHTIHVTAPGYFPEDREVQAAEGGTVALDISMREQPGRISVNAMPGADVVIDGRVADTTPLTRPIEVSAGSHFFAVTHRGYKPFSQDLDIARGEARTITAKLEVTGQRVGAIALGAAALAGLAAGGTLGILAVVKQGQAESLETQRTRQGGLPSSAIAGYNDDVSARNTLRTGAGIALFAGGTLGLTAIFMAVFDQPAVGRPGRRDDRPKPESPAPRDRSLDVMASPLVGPGLYGATVGARF